MSDTTASTSAVPLIPTKDPAELIGTFLHNPIRAVRVTAADFNGETWDGLPFSAYPDWLKAAAEAKQVRPEVVGGRDYTWWQVEVKDRDGDIVMWYARPGDYIALDYTDRLVVLTGVIFDGYFRVQE